MNTLIRTDHFSFKLKRKINSTPNGTEYSTTFLIGNKNKPCLSLFLYSEIKKNQEDTVNYRIDYTTANLMNIDGLYDCIEDDISEEDFNKFSFSKELLTSIIDFIKINYPHIKKINLDDASYMPCNRKAKDTVDLLTYSVAHHSKTWYELFYKAYMRPLPKYKRYRSEVDKYSSEEFKALVSWTNFTHHIFIKSTPFAQEKLANNYELYKSLYENSRTFPIFFREMTKTLNKLDKCKFYKFWLEHFINSNISFTRTWTIDVI